MKIDLVRPDDLLNLRIEAVNLRLDLKNPKSPVLVVEDPKKSAYLIVVFPPQTITETAYFENSVVPSAEDPNVDVPLEPESDPARPDPEAAETNSEKLDPPGVIGKRNAVAKMANASRLVFKVPPKVQIPYSVQGLLDWSRLELQVSPIAAIGDNPTSDQIANAPPIQEPKQTETALELPYQLLISPTSEVAWKHRFNPVAVKGRTELWHTRLQLQTENRPVELSRDNPASLRAIWSNYPNYDPSKRPNTSEDDPDLGRTAMSRDDRWQIVILTSAFHDYIVQANTTFNIGVLRHVYHLHFQRPYVPRPFYTERLMLSSLGGWLRSRGNWTPPRKGKVATFQVVPTLEQIVSVLQETHPGLQLKEAPTFATAVAATTNLTQIKGIGKKRAEKLKTMSINNLVELSEASAEPIVKKLKVSTKTVDKWIASAKETVTAIGVVPGIVPVSPQETEELQLDLSEWIHMATQGRDHYVRIVYEGELWPFRHRAALIKVTERKFKENGGIVGAYLIQRNFIVVREPEKHLDERGNPFQMVRLTTMVTPDIADPIIIKNLVTNEETHRSFWVEVTTTSSPRELFRFHAVGKDWADNLVDFTIPLMFVSISDLPDADPDKAKLVMTAYNAVDKTEPRSARLYGQKVAFAKPDVDSTKRNDNTQLVTESLTFVVDELGSPAKMLKAEVKIPQIQDLLDNDTSTWITYYDNYLHGDFDAKTEVFAKIIEGSLSPSFKPDEPRLGLTDSTFGLDFTSDKAGGFTTPNMNISTLTRKLGPVAGEAAKALDDEFDPSKFFEGVTAQLFGAFDLVNLLLPTTLSKNAPKLKTETEDVAGGKLVRAILEWEPEIKEVDLGIATFKNQGKNGTPSKLAVHGMVQKTVNLDKSTTPSTFQFTGELTDFVVSILNSVSINFTEFSFEAKDGKKPDINVKLDPATPVEFAGDLKFVEELRKAIPPDLFGAGLSLDVSPTGIKAGFAFALPPISVGVFSLKDVSLAAAVTLPFLDGKPTFDFNVSEREQPFLLTVYFFGGGGYFHLQLDTLGMKELEAALEFGATASLDLGVASGEVHIMAGIYFSLQREEVTFEYAAILSGYMRMGGSLSVLGLINVSVEFNLSFTYDSARDKAYGRATLTVEVAVLFFSVSVELTVERGFGGSGDPHFNELFTKPEMWSDYALAFA